MTAAWWIRVSPAPQHLADALATTTHKPPCLHGHVVVRVLDVVVVLSLM